jgi:polysaccharide biosynthesis protein PslH
VRLLHVTPELPFHPGGSGGSTRQFRLLADLVRRGHDVDVVSPVHPDQDVGREQLAAAGIALHSYDRSADRLADAWTTVRRSPGAALAVTRMPLLAWQVEMFWARMREPLAAALRAGAPDVIVVEHDWAARWWQDLPAGVPRALTLENLSWAYYEQRATAAPGALRAALMRREAQRFARFDGRHLAHYDLLLAMSDLDRVRAAEVTGTRCAVVPNGVETADIPANDPVAEPVAVFAGSMGYPPNAEALRWLLGTIWPAVRATLPEARLVVVGRDVPADLEASAPASVTFTGFVADIAQVYSTARVVLCPMLSGAGTRLKVLEGLATGLPLVSTTMGAEGVHVTDREDVLLADGAERFTATTIEALTDDALARRIGAAGRWLAVERYDWRTIAGTLEQLLLELPARADRR